MTSSSSWNPRPTSTEDGVHLPSWAEDKLEKILALYFTPPFSSTLSEICARYLQSLAHSTPATHMENTFDHTRKLFLSDLVKANLLQENAYRTLETKLEALEEEIMHQS